MRINKVVGKCVRCNWKLYTLDVNGHEKVSMPDGKVGYLCVRCRSKVEKQNGYLGFIAEAYLKKHY